MDVKAELTTAICRLTALRGMRLRVASFVLWALSR